MAFMHMRGACMPEKKPATKQAGITHIAASYIMINVYSNMVFKCKIIVVQVLNFKYKPQKFYLNLLNLKSFSPHNVPAMQ